MSDQWTSGGEPLWTSVDAAAATGCSVSGSWTAHGVSIDSRTIRPGDLFVAIAGPRFDGHEFVADAFRKGAVAALVHRAPPNVPESANLLPVDDTLEGLAALGRYARLRTEARLVGVTGSVGKTGTKEALGLALGGFGDTHASPGSFNNHWGVPLSLARLPVRAAFGIFELGMNHGGEIAPLSCLVKPDVAIITTVEAVHIENFDSVEGIADAKAEIFAGMGPDGTAILKRDNAHFPRLVAHARTQGLGRIWSFGRHSDAEARIDKADLHATSSAVEATILGEPVRYVLSAPGEHWVLNSLAVLLAVKAVGQDVAAAARTLSGVDLLKGRGARQRVRLDGASGAGSFLLIDESYNASPVAVTAALQVLGMADLGDRGRRIAVLGDMLELGEHAAEMHRGLARPIELNEVDLVFACGPMMAELLAALPADKRGGFAEDSLALAPLVAAAVGPGDAVMVKGSLGSAMNRVVEALRALDGRRDGRPANDNRHHRGGS